MMKVKIMCHLFGLLSLDTLLHQLNRIISSNQVISAFIFADGAKLRSFHVGN